MIFKDGGKMENKLYLNKIFHRTLMIQLMIMIQTLKIYHNKIKNVL
jgi:hypothetical protein